MINGLRIVESSHLTVPYEDWSEVRSPSRALRRLKRGYKQRIKIIQIPDPNAYQFGDTLYMHPVTAVQLRRMVKDKG